MPFPTKAHPPASNSPTPPRPLTPQDTRTRISIAATTAVMREPWLGRLGSRAMSARRGLETAWSSMERADVQAICLLACFAYSSRLARCTAQGAVQSNLKELSAKTKPRLSTKLLHSSSHTTTTGHQEALTYTSPLGAQLTHSLARTHHSRHQHSNIHHGRRGAAQGAQGGRRRAHRSVSRHSA